MSTILKNILDFNGLVLNVPASLPHQLNINDVPVTPKLGGASAEGFTITADATNVTVTRTINAESGTVRVYVEYWHSIESVTPLPGQLAGLTPFFFAASGNDISPIVVEADGVPLPNPPHATLDFVGTGIAATDAGGGVAQITANADVLVYRPGAVGVEAPGGNVFTVWGDLMTAIDQTRYRGMRSIQFDNRFAPPSPTGVPPASGLNPCLIPAPPIPLTPYDMRDVAWVDRFLPPGGGTMMVEIQDGARIDNLKTIDMSLLNIIYNGRTVGNHPFVTGVSTYGWNFRGVRFRLYNTDPLAQPMWLVNSNPAFLNLTNDSGIGNGVTLPAPVIEIAAGSQFIAIMEKFYAINNNAFVGPVGSTVNLRLVSAESLAGYAAASHSLLFPAFAGAITVQNQLLMQRWHPSATIAAGATVDAVFGAVQRVNSTANPVRVNLPKASVTAPTTGTFGYIGSAITVVDVGGAADLNAITVRAAIGDSINGVVELGGGESDKQLPASAYSSLRFWTDGLGAWFIIA